MFVDIFINIDKTINRYYIIIYCIFHLSLFQSECHAALSWLISKNTKLKKSSNEFYTDKKVGYMYIYIRIHIAYTLINYATTVNMPVNYPELFSLF